MISDAAAGQNHTIVHLKLSSFCVLGFKKKTTAKQTKKPLTNITSKQVYTFFSLFYLNRILKIFFNLTALDTNAFGVYRHICS